MPFEENHEPVHIAAFVYFDDAVVNVRLNCGVFEDAFSEWISIGMTSLVSAPSADGDLHRLQSCDRI